MFWRDRVLSVFEDQTSGGDVSKGAALFAYLDFVTQFVYLAWYTVCRALAPRWLSWDSFNRLWLVHTGLYIIIRRITLIRRSYGIAHETRTLLVFTPYYVLHCLE